MSSTRTAIVTAAGRGIGAGIARRLVANGWNVGLLSPGEGVVALAAELGGVAVRGSVTEPADLERLVHATSARFGPITGAAINMGHPPKGPLLELTDADWHAGFDMAVMPAIRIARLLTPGMKAAGGGAFVVVSSAVAFEPESDFPMSTLRAGLGAWVKLYADTYAKDAIRMNALLPGFTDSLPEKADRRARIPAGRYGTVVEIANVAAFLLSDDATYVTGQNVRVDGGLTRGV